MIFGADVHDLCVCGRAPPLVLQKLVLCVPFCSGVKGAWGNKSNQIGLGASPAESVALG